MKHLGTHFEQNGLSSQQFKTRKIKCTIKQDSTSLWKTQLTVGNNSEWLLNQVELDHLHKNPIPQNLSRIQIHLPALV